MNVSTKQALHEALDAAAPDGDAWIKGEKAYKKTIKKDKDDTQRACENALNAAAPDEAAWIKGRNVFVINGMYVLPASKTDSLKNWTTKKLVTPFASDKDGQHWSAKAAPTLLLKLLVFGLGMLIFFACQPALFASYHASYGVGTGTAASIALFVFVVLLFLVIGEAIIKSLRRSHPTPTPTAS